MQRIISLRKVINSEELKNTMCILPLSFGHGLIGNSLLPFLSGANLFIAPVFNSNFFLVWKEWLQKHKITFFSTVPSFWRMLGRSDQLPKNTSLLRVHCASSVFTFNLWSQIENWIIEQNINFYNVYGLTEFASWVSGYNLKEEGYRPNYIGRTWGVDCKAIETNVDNIGEGCEVIETNVGSIGEIYEAIETNVDSIGEICEAIETNVGGIGEICLDSDSKMLGYLDERNASVLKADSWIKTGDIGKIENDKLFFYGRSTNTINRGGKKISPEEIENVINLHEKVKDSFVFGHQLKSSEQQIIALVNPRVSGENQSVLLNELKLLCRSKLSKYKIPSIWHIVDDLFYNARGKLDRKKSFEHFINSKTLF